MGTNYRDLKFDKPYTMGGESFDPDSIAFTHIQPKEDNMSWDPKEWTDDDADLMFIAHLMTKKGSEWYIDQIGKGTNKKAEIEAYFKFHHTDESKVIGEGKDRILKIFNEEGE